MQFPRTRPHRDEQQGILPLTNIVFLLLIFFMLAGRLTALDPFRITPPQSSSPVPAEHGDITVQIGADGRIALDGEIMPAAQLQRALLQRLHVDPPAEVRLQADAQVEANRVVDVMTQLHALGVDHLRLLTHARQR